MFSLLFTIITVSDAHPQAYGSVKSTSSYGDPKNVADQPSSVGHPPVSNPEIVYVAEEILIPVVKKAGTNLAKTNSTGPQVDSQDHNSPASLSPLSQPGYGNPFSTETAPSSVDASEALLAPYPTALAVETDQYSPVETQSSSAPIETIPDSKGSYGNSYLSTPSTPSTPQLEPGSTAPLTQPQVTQTQSASPGSAYSNPKSPVNVESSLPISMPEVTQAAILPQSTTNANTSPVSMPTSLASIPKTPSLTPPSVQTFPAVKTSQSPQSAAPVSAYSATMPKSVETTESCESPSNLSPSPSSNPIPQKSQVLPQSNTLQPQTQLHPSAYSISPYSTKPSGYSKPGSGSPDSINAPSPGSTQRPSSGLSSQLAPNSAQTSIVTTAKVQNIPASASETYKSSSAYSALSDNANSVFHSSATNISGFITSVLLISLCWL